MPQLDPASFGSQLFWLVLCFGILFALMAFIVLPRIGKTLANRQARIDNDLAAAEELRAQAEAALVAYEDALANARSVALVTAQQIRADMQGDIDRQKAELDGRLNSEAEAAEKRLAAARQTALAGVEDAAQDIVAEVMAAINIPPPAPEMIKKAIKECQQDRDAQNTDMEGRDV